MIEASALLHQYQRQSTDRNGQTYLLATIEDYAISREVAIVLLPSVLSGATPKCRALVEWAQKAAEDGKSEFSKKDVDKAMKWTRKTSLKYLGEAVALGCIGMDATSVAKSKLFHFAKTPEVPSLDLPTPEELMGSESQPSPDEAAVPLEAGGAKDGDA